MTGEESQTVHQSDKELLAIDSFLKLSRSVKFELVPADENYLDMKTYDWSLF